MKPQDRELLGILVAGGILYRSDHTWTVSFNSQVRRVSRSAGRLLEEGLVEPEPSSTFLVRYVPTQKGREAAV